MASTVTWAPCVLFLLLAGHAGVLAVRDRTSPTAVVGHLLHLLMAVDMVLMALEMGNLATTWSPIPAWMHGAVFAAGTSWYLALLAVWCAGVPRRRQAARHTGWSTVGHLVHHTVMMLAMVWMAAAMAAGDHHHGGGHISGPEMSMLSTPMALLGVACTVTLVAGATLLTVEVVERRREQPRLTGILRRAASPVMSYAMAVMCWAMTTL